MRHTRDLTIALVLLSTSSLLGVAEPACTPKPIPAPAPLPKPAPGTECDAAQARLLVLKCPEASLDFADACKRALVDGRDWRADCIAVVATCDLVPVAYRTPKGAPCAK